MKAELVNPFITAAVNVISTMAQVTPIADKPYLKENKLTWGVISGVIGMAGHEVTGNMVISFDEPTILLIVSNMLMGKFEKVDDQVADAVGEITNMISGGAKQGLEKLGMSFDMASPMTIRGKDVELSQITREPIIGVPFHTEAGKFVVEVSLAPRAK